MDNSVKFNLKQPSQMLIKNIHMNWLQYIHAKTHKKMPIYLNESSNKLKNIPTGFGTIKENVHDYDENTALEIHFSNCAPIKKSILKLDIIVQQQDALQYFIQWQRYRKYWWSTVSIFLSLFFRFTGSPFPVMQHHLCWSCRTFMTSSISSVPHYFF